MKNLFADIPQSLPDELSDVLVNSPHVRVERIVSTGQRSDEDFWYDQDEHEWVVVLKGNATLQFKDDLELVDMKSGDCINIAAHRRHRIVWTTADEPTVWLAVFYNVD